MLISIQPLDSRGQPTDKAFTSDWGRFIEMNDGFKDCPREFAQMEAVLRMGAGYIIGGGAAGAFRLKKVEESDTSEDYEHLLDQEAAHEAERLSFGDV